MLFLCEHALIVVIMLLTVFFMPFHMLDIMNFIPSKTVDIVVFIFSQAVETTPHIVLSITEKKAEIEFQISEKKFLTDVHTSFQLVPNKPKNTSAMPLSVSRILPKKFFIKSHIPVNISFTPFHTRLQFPVKNPMKHQEVREVYL